MTDPDEKQLSELAKRVLSMPPKKREDSKIGERAKPPPKKASPSSGGKPKK